MDIVTRVLFHAFTKLLRETLNEFHVKSYDSIILRHTNFLVKCEK